MPTRSALPVAALKIATLDWWIGMVLSTMPPVVPFSGFGLVCFLTRLMPSTSRWSVVLAQRDRAALALVAAGQHDDLVAFANLVHGVSCRPYRTSGASDTIFMNFSVRSSRVTGPKMRVPIGSSLVLSSTAALPSNLTSEPSLRRMPLAVRTTTAL